MLQINRLSVNTIGKIKKPWINEAINQYLKRMPELSIQEFKSFKNKNFKNNNHNNMIVSLSEEGNQYNSNQFSSMLLKFQDKKILFFIGGSDGLTPDFKSKSDLLLSLSPLTFPHEIARLILIEQIYRALMITQNSPYHRD